MPELGGRRKGPVGQWRERRPTRPDTIPLAYAGKWIAWSEDGLRILAVGDDFDACERAAVAAGHAPNRIAIGHVPGGRIVSDEGRG